MLNDYIRRSDVLKLFDEWGGGFAYIEVETDGAIKAINDLPPAEPEIIRCKDCKDYQTDWEISNYPNRHFCATMDSTMPEDGFCSYAERKDNGPIH